MRIGILGTGAIGSEIARAVAAWPEVVSVALCDLDANRAAKVAAAAGPKGRVVGTGVDLIEACDLFVETATQEAAKEWAPRALEAGRDVLMLSLGALADDAFHASLEALARAKRRKVYLPSGAICGIDLVKAASFAELKSVTLVTTKPPAGLGVDVDKWTVVFEGSAREAVRRFPKNVNVALCLSLAGLGPDETRVQVVADPLSTRNQHKVIVEGAFGRARIEVENLPSPDNPKTSYLASLSAIATLRRILEPIQVGA